MGVVRLRRRGDERGAVAIIVAIVMVLLMAITALVVDLGNHWQTRRRLITSTDSAALAAARTFAYKEGDGCASASDYLLTNAPKAINVQCEPFFVTPSMGWVRVTANQDVATGFAGVMGIDSMRSKSSSTAQWGTPRNMAGILPFGVCASNPVFASYAGDPTQIVSMSGFNPQNQSPTCTNGNNWLSPGDWATIAVNGTNPVTGASTNTTVCNFGGYQAAMKVDDWVLGDTGNIFQSLYNKSNPADTNYALGCMYDSYLKDPSQWYGMAVLDEAVKSAGKTSFHVVGFVGVQVTSLAAKDPNNPGIIFNIRYFQFPTGEAPCCDPRGGGTTKAIRLCAIDAQDPATRCIR